MRAVKEPLDHLYKEVQFALRAAVGTRTLDALLEDKSAVDRAVAEQIAGHFREIGIAVRGIGLKDIIDDAGNASNGLRYLDMSFSDGLTEADALANAQATYSNARLAILQPSGQLARAPVDLGVLDAGWFFDPTFQWGTASSPIICDTRTTSCQPNSSRQSAGSPSRPARPVSW